MRRLYLAVFNLPHPQREHLKIVEVIRAASGGDFAQAQAANGGMYAFASETPPWMLSFDRILHGADSVAFVEIGEQTDIRGFGAIAGWLNRHRPRR